MASKLYEARRIPPVRPGRHAMHWRCTKLLLLSDRRMLLARCTLAVMLLAVVSVPAQGDDAQGLAALGRALFHDHNLSLQRTQSCASCHSPERGFADARRVLADGAVSLGADGVSAGRRNAPTLTYVGLVPPFQRDAEGYLGGLFLDGRAPSLLEQISGPLHAAGEMAMPDAASVAARLRERPDYLSALREAGAVPQGASDEALYAGAFRALVAFERSAAFSTFDSKYDRFLAGEYEMTLEERMGREVFFSDLANCRQCHLQEPQRRALREPFTNFRYFNIGVPRNRALDSLPGDRPAVDEGIAEHLKADAAVERGKFRVPTLRNVAVTGPYMHNGVFQTLDTAVRFYGHYIVSSTFSETNPETGGAWGEPEVADNLAADRLGQGQPLTGYRIRQLVAFLKTLTDQRYEVLLDGP